MVRSILYFCGAALALAVLTSEVCAAEPLPADYYGRLPLIDSPSLSPDGSIIAYFAPIKGLRCVVFKDLAHDSILSVTCPQAEEEVEWLHWKSNKRVILAMFGSTSYYKFLIKTTHLVSIDVNSGVSTELIQPANGLHVGFRAGAVVDFMDADPAHILMEINASPPFRDVIQVDVNSGNVVTILKQQDNVVVWFGDGTGHVRVGGKVDKGQRRLEYRETPDRPFSLVPYSPILGPQMSPLAFADQPNEIYVESDAETGREAIYRFDLATGLVKDRLASHDKIDIDRALVRHGRFIGYEYTDDQIEQVFTEPSWQRDQASIEHALPNMHVRIIDRTDDGHRALIMASKGSQPEKLYLLNRQAGKPTTLDLLNATYPWIPDAAVAPVKPVDYPARDGLMIHGYVTLPPGPVPAGPIPFVVLPHGGPGARDKLEFDFLAQMIASRGYGVLQPNFRGSIGRGAAFVAAGLQEWGLHMQDDVTDGTKWLIDQKMADPQRIGIVGWSYGGYAALMGAIKEPGLYRCAASMAGVTNLERIYGLQRPQHPFFGGGSLEGDLVHQDENSPVRQADKIKIPILLLHGKLDVNVPVYDTELMAKALESEHKKFEVVYFPDDDHYLFHEANRMTLMTKLEKFLKDNLGPVAVH